MDEDRDVSSLLLWLDQNGVSTSMFCCAVHDFGRGEGRGLIAKRDIDEGEVILSMPQRFLMCYDLAFESGRLGEILKQCIKERAVFITCSAVVLLVHFLYEHMVNKDSFWKSYFPVLPKCYHNSSSFTDKLMEMLQNNSHIQEAKRLREEANTLYFHSLISFINYANEHLGNDFWPRDLIPSFEQFLWGWQTLQTRGCYFEADFKLNASSDKTGLPIKSSADNCCLIPFIDFANHSPHVDCSAGFNKETNCYEIRTHTPFKKGEQVFISYGKHGNSTLLHFYGFVTSPNPFDSICLDINPILQKFQYQTNNNKHTHSKNLKGKGKEKETEKSKQGSSEFVLRKSILKENFGLDFEGVYFIKKSSGGEEVEFSWNLFTALRVLFSTQNDIKEKNYFSAMNEEIVSEECETTV
eukprot:TRINITY_DN446_c0_g5_i1.p1 TRINITY_DN446_c0_g5~~TRINITY_DN446_c0_g5_i1.p1  ORF type:complete len:423 (-),score=99.30 TRINITY_DN446_c0_g5_i1:18-1250(-)